MNWIRDYTPGFQYGVYSRVCTKKEQECCCGASAEGPHLSLVPQDCGKLFLISRKLSILSVKEALEQDEEILGIVQY